MINSLNKKIKGFQILNIFNNSSPKKLLFLAKKIKKSIRNSDKIKINQINNSSYDHNPTEIKASNKLSKKLLNWRPKFSLDKIIKKQIKYYEDKKYN